MSTLPHMSPDAAIFACLVNHELRPRPLHSQADHPARAALRVSARMREVTALLREASFCLGQMKEGRRASTARLAALLAQAEGEVDTQLAETGRVVALISRACLER